MMRAHATSAVLLALLCALPACTTAARPLPTSRSATMDVLQPGAGTLCIEPVDSDLDLSCCRDRVATFETMLAEELRAAGFAVVEAETTREARLRILGRHGGYFDTATGARDEERYRRLTPVLADALTKELGCTAMVRPYLAVVQSQWRNLTAEWDGASESVAGGAFLTYGTVSALSLWLTIGSPDESRELYFRSGGVQVLAGMQRARFTAPKQWTAVSRDRILADPERNRRAIRLALEPFRAAPR